MSISQDGKFKVLIVDDEEGPRRAIEAALYREHHLEIKSARSGPEALQYFETGPFDLVLTDIKMPQMDGLELLRRIRERFPETLVILITGYGSLNSAIDAIRAGAYDYLTKPFQVEELCIIVERAVEKIRLLRENRKLLEELGVLFEKVRGNIAERDGSDEGGRNLELLKEVRKQLSRIHVRYGLNS